MQLLPVSSIHKTYQKPIIYREYLKLGKNSQNLTCYEIAGFSRPNFFMFPTDRVFDACLRTTTKKL